MGKLTIAFVDSEDIVTHCGSGVGTVPRITSLGVKKAYSLNWEALYHCMGDKGLFDSNIPNTDPVPLRGVHWGVELGGKCGQAGQTCGDAAIWAIVEDMRMAL